MTEAVQQIINALALGSVYALVALGLALIFSILGLVNFAQGQLITLGGYAMWAVGSATTFWPAIFLAAILAPAVAALALDRLVFRRMRDAPQATMLLVSVALGIILQTGFNVFFGTESRPIPYPHWVQATVHIGSIRVQAIDIVTVGVTLLALLGLNLGLRRALVGLSLRAAAEDMAVTRLMGVRAGVVVGVAFVVSGLLAGVAAIFWFAGSGIVAPDAGLVPLLKGFIAVVIGGLGSPRGAVIAGFGLGALEVLCQATLPSDVVPYTDTFIFTALLLVVLVRPGGLASVRQRLA